MISTIWARNIGILTEAEQAKVITTRLLIAGCGLGSVIAELAVRLGFENILLADGDRVEITNLNRQIFDNSDIGKNKAEATARRLTAINPKTRVKAIPQFIGLADIHGLLSEVDLVIDAIDISAIQVILALHREARRQQKIVLFPLNLVWGAGLFVFTPTSASIEELLGLEPDCPLEEAQKMYDDQIIFDRWLKMCKPYLPGYIDSLLFSFLERVKAEGWCPLPQVGVGSYLSAALTIVAAIRILLDFPVPIAPNMCTLDTWMSLEV